MNLLKNEVKMGENYEISYKNDEFVLKIGEKEVIFDENTGKKIISELSFAIASIDTAKTIKNCKNQAELKEFIQDTLKQMSDNISYSIHCYSETVKKVNNYLNSEDFLKF